MESDYFVPCLIIMALLNTLQQPDSNPSFFALHQSSHDLRHTISIKQLGFKAVHVFLVIFCSFLFAGPLGHHCIPGVGIFDAESFNCGGRKFRGSFSLGFAADEARAIGFAAITWLRVSTVAIDVVVEDKFFPSLDSSFGENAHAKLVADNPFVDIAIRVARVVAKSTKIASFCSIDELALAQGHEIEMFDAFLIVLNHTFSKRGFRNSFTNVFEDEVVGPEIRVCTEAIAFLLGLDNRYIGIKASEKSLVLTRWTTAAIIRTFHLACTVDAVGIVAAGEILPGAGVWFPRSALSHRASTLKCKLTPFLRTFTIQGMFAESQKLILICAGVDDGEC